MYIFGSKLEESKKDKKEDIQNCKNCKYKSSKNVLIVFQLACLSIIILNANLIGQILFSSIQSGFSVNQFILVVAVVLNILEIMNNWASIKIYIKYYIYTWLFILDILTLGTYYIQIDLLQSLQKANLLENEKIILIIIVSYILIYALYSAWNWLIKLSFKNFNLPKEKNTERQEKDINCFTWIRTGLTITLLVFIIVHIHLHFSENILIITYFCFILVCIVLWLVHNKTIQVLDTIMNAEELGQV